MSDLYDVIIIGSGPAGLTAGIYTSRANLKTLCIAGYAWGGQLMQTTLVENFPGFPDGIQGPDLMLNMRKQAERMGVQFVDRNAEKIDFSNKPYTAHTANETYVGKCVIVATGAEFKWLGIKGEQDLIGRGVSACATCDAAFFKERKVVVVGGGDSAMEEALFLTKFASEVIIVHRKTEFRASKVMQDKVFANSKIKVLWNTEIIEVLGKNSVTGVKTKSGDTIDCDGLFVAIGHNPATNMFEGVLDLDPKKYLNRLGQKYKTMANVEGVFIAGDVHDYIYRQAITAAGYGCEAAIEAERWLTEKQKSGLM
jgi:thioredoxin reductase (NADPH)